MKIQVFENGVKLLNPENFSLEQTFECGQCFKWQKQDGKYKGIAFNKELVVYNSGNDIIFENISLNEFDSIWADYFDLNTDYSRIIKHLSNINPILKQATDECPGIRILRQDPWEALCSFIISQNNNIPRIKKIINLLCQNFSDSPNNIKSFPSADTIAKLSEQDLSPIRAGFRAKYIIDAAEKVSKGIINLESIATMPIEEAKNNLMQIKGVGPKVADCVMLYGLHNLSAFPIDVWMKKIMDKFFKGQNPSIFGPYAGVAQQYLYHYIRSHPEVLI